MQNNGPGIKLALHGGDSMESKMPLDSTSFVELPIGPVSASELARGDAGLRRFDAMWRAHARDGLLPAMDHIDPSAVADLIDRVLLVDVNGTPDSPRFRAVVVGDRHREDPRHDPVGKELGAEWMPAYQPQALSKALSAAAQTGLPHRGGAQVAYPLSSNGRDIDSVICLAAF